MIEDSRKTSGSTSPARLVASLHGISVYQDGITMRETSEPIQLRSAIDIYIAAQSKIVTEHTIRTYHNAADYLCSYFGEDRPIETLQKVDMVAWRTSLYEAEKWHAHPRISGKRGSLSVPTIRRIMGTASAIFNWLVSAELLDRNPLRGVKRPTAPQKKPKAIQKHELDLMLQEAGNYIGTHRRFKDAYEARHSAIILFLASSGCRVGGMCSARIEDLTIFDDGAEIELFEKGKGGGKSHVYNLSALAVAAILEWLEHRPTCDNDLIFVGVEGRSAGNPMTPRGVAARLRQIANQVEEIHGVKIKYANPHSFREALGREMLNNGADLATVSQTLGHSDIRVTAAHYTRFLSRELREKKKKFGYI